MEIQSATREKGSVVAHLWGRFKGFPGKLKAKLVGVAKSIKKLGQDDPRRVIHSLKVGLALTLVSLLYYLRPLYNGFGASGIWAVLTVVVVFEFTVGATVSKCLNRGFATLLAGGLGVGAQYLANFFGEQGEPIVLGIVVFLLGAAATFSRFFPRIKARYDYGVVIFILTFSLVTVSGYRVDNISQLFDQRLLTIIIGVGMCMIIAIFLCPVWAGEDLHNLVALNLEKLANYLEGFGGEYFLASQEGESIVVISKDDKSCLQGYKSVLNSKSTEDSLANFARWEPGHGRFQFNHPWKQYLKIGALTRQCAYQIEALNSYINSAPQAPQEFLRKIKESCTKVSSESSKALKVISSAIKTMKDPSAANYHVENSESAIQDLKIALQATFLEESDLLAVIPVATVASVLIEIVTCVEEIVESVHELSQLAHFKGAKESAITPEKPMLLHRGSINPILDVGNADVVIAVDETSLVSPEKGNLEAPITSRRVEV